MGSKSGALPSSAQPQAARQLHMTSSSLGQVIPLLYGENRLAGNLLFAFYFTAIESKGGPSGGKSGGPSIFVQYTYTVSALLALSEGALAASFTDERHPTGVVCAVPQQTLMIGRATPGAQALTVSDKTGKKTDAQLEAGIQPGVWKTKKVRRVVDDKGHALDPDGDDTDLKKGFRPMRWHNWDEAPNGDTGLTARARFITGPGDFIWGAWKNSASPNPTEGTLKQRNDYIRLANENYFGIACVGRQNIRLGQNASLPNNNFPERGLMQFRDIYATAGLNGAHSDSVTTITVDSTGIFASSGSVRIDGEVITYTGKTSTTLTGCIRGAGTPDTDPHAHTDGSRVYDERSERQIFDADPACVLLDLLTNPKHGAGWDRPVYEAMLQGWPNPWGAKLSASSTPALPADSWSAYCRAQNILISPLWDSQRSMADILTDLAEMTNTAIVWSEGRLKLIPYGDAAVTSTGTPPERFTGVTFTPTTDPALTTDGANIGVRYALTTDHFLPGKNKDAVQIQRRAIVPDVRDDYKSDGLFNHVRVEFLNAANGYAVEVAEVKDMASIADVGLIAREPEQRHELTNAVAALAVAERRLKRLVVVRNVYTFTLGWQFVLLEPMDVVTLTDAAIGLNATPVRITSISEDKEGALEMEAEDFPGDFPQAATPAPPVDVAIQEDGGGVWVGSNWTYGDDYQNPLYYDVAGAVFAFATWEGTPVPEPGASPRGVDLCAVDNASITVFRVTMVDQDGSRTDVFDVAARLRIMVDDSPSVALVEFSAGDLGMTKTWHGVVGIPAQSRVCVEVGYVLGDVFAPSRTAANPSTGPRTATFHWAIGWEPT